MDEPVTLKQLSWILGTKSGPLGEGTTTETWTQKDENTFEGKTSYQKEGKEIFGEYLLIQNINGSIVYIAVPQGQKPTLFNLSNTDADKRASFENMEHDFPQRITYEKESDMRIKIILEGKIKDKDAKEEYYIEAK
jgi:hypothetical protein